MDIDGSMEISFDAAQAMLFCRAGSMLLGNEAGQGRLGRFDAVVLDDRRAAHRVEGRGAFGAIRRSAQLTWPVFWLVFRAVTIPVLAEGVFDELITSLPFLHGMLAHVLTTVLLEMPVAAFLALVEVTLAYHLIERDRPGIISAHS